MGAWLLLLVAAATAVGLLVYSQFFRSLVSAVLRVALFVGASLVAIVGITILMNGETVFEPPGVGARLKRFLTVNYAATSHEGFGDATCALGDKSAAGAAAGASVRARSFAARHGKASGAEQPGQPAQSLAAASQDVYPELIARKYPGISRAELLRMAQDTVNALRGWKIIGSDPRSGTLDCLYTSRIFGFQDEVTIVVTRRNEIDLCSRSKTGTPGSDPWLGFFHGDFGANLGHINQFYTALEPRVEAFYRTRKE